MFMLCCGTRAAHCLLQVLAQQGRARTATMKLPHYTAETPMFMPVGTQGEQQQPASCNAAASCFTKGVRCVRFKRELLRW